MDSLPLPRRAALDSRHGLPDHAGRGRVCIVTGELDPPPLKWSDLKYVLWHQGGSEHAKEEAHA